MIELLLGTIEMMRRMNRTSRGCWRGKEMRTSRWRSNSIWNSIVSLRVWVLYNMHTNLDVDVIHMHGKRTR
jgi:hypothetical protein